MNETRFGNKQIDSQILSIDKNVKQLNLNEQIDASPSKNESTIDIREPNDEHLRALQTAFDKILSERLLSDESLQKRRIVFQQIQQIIQSQWTDCQINLYGSLLFNCCLEKPGTMDIDVYLKQISPYETLKQIRDLLIRTDFCREANVNTDSKPICIDLISNESNIRMRMTSGYNRGIYLSKLIRIYTKFDSRLIKLLRIFRIFSKTCNIDKPDFGTLHPVVYHLMIIHFLQQIEPAILPCLHEYIFGIDHVPLIFNENQYDEFFRHSIDYSHRWKSTNSLTIERLFLQFLSYYVKRFHSKQFLVSIQTRMPIVKIDKNWHGRKLFVEDPIDIKRNLCQTMQSTRSINYFREILTTALNYFGRKQTKTTICSNRTNEEFIEIPLIESQHALHNSYEIFSEKFPMNIFRDTNIRQNHIRDIYKRNFPEQISECLMKINENEQFLQELDEEEEEEEEDDSEIFNAKQSIVRQLFAPTTVRSSDKDKIPSVFSSPIKNQSISNEETSSNEFFYDFQPENFHAEQGAPFVCMICNAVGHLKSQCPELIVPNLIDLPDITQQWIDVLSLLCSRITERCQPTEADIKNREEILRQLQKQFEKDYPDCSLHAFGSFYNGFGFRQSDLDVCIVFKEQQEKNSDEVISIMRKILKSMRSNFDLFENVQPVLHAKVPIIRSRHRKLHIEIDISLHNMLAIENTRLLKTYTEIDSRVSQLGYMIKYLAKTCDIGNASRGTLSSYAYIIMLIHFLQQIQPTVLPVLQELNDDSTRKKSMIRKCSKWNVYFYEDLTKLKTFWKSENHLSTGSLWIEFLRFYTEYFNYDEYVVTIRQKQPLLKHEKGWLRQTIAIEDPFELTHNLARSLSVKNWSLIRRVFIRARQQFACQIKDFDSKYFDIQIIESILFNIDSLCPSHAPRRCIECHGPYHIRKHCPKLITLAAEKDKLKHRSHLSLYSAYSYPSNGYQYKFQRIWTQPYSNEGPIIHSNFSVTNNNNINNNLFMANRSFYSNNQRRKQCFRCGSSNHIKSQCPQFQR